MATAPARGCPGKTLSLGPDLRLTLGLCPGPEGELPGFGAGSLPHTMRFRLTWPLLAQKQRLWGQGGPPGRCLSTHRRASTTCL